MGSGAETDSNPSEMRVFLNRDDIDFDNVEEIAPTQAWELPERSGAPDEEFHHPTAFAKFQNVQTLVVYLPANHGAELTKLLFLGFRGVSTGDRRGVVKAVYEARAVPSDHAAPATVAGALGM